jgi:NAD(P)-dependent dehydrogenase (short-subunit alcohol dehydrogenase family)
MSEVFLVTRGAGGVGAAVARRFAAAGGRVVVADIGEAWTIQAGAPLAPFPSPRSTCREPADMEFFVYHRDRAMTEKHWSDMDRFQAQMIARGPTLTADG